MPDLFAAGVMEAARQSSRTANASCANGTAKSKPRIAGGKREMDCRGGDRRLRDVDPLHLSNLARVRTRPRYGLPTVCAIRSGGGYE
jgi:hypothetical protein